MGWLAQITLFLMLGLLVTPHDLLPLVAPALIVALVLIFVARPLAAALCLLPFGLTLPETGFVAWVGLRDSRADLSDDHPHPLRREKQRTLFGVVFVIVVVSVAFQARRLRPSRGCSA